MNVLQKVTFQLKVYKVLSLLNIYLLYNHIFNLLKPQVQHTLVYHTFNIDKQIKDCSNLQDQNRKYRFCLNFYIIYYQAKMLLLNNTLISLCIILFS